MSQQSRDTHKPPKELSAKKGKRHAAPIHYHLAESDGGKLLIRATTFPAHCLPNFDESKRMLDELLSFIETKLKDRVKKGANIGQREAKPRSGGLETGQSSKPSADLPKTGARVEAELLADKTKKGGWKAKHVDSGLQGPIQDTNNAPADAEPGQRVKLTVASVSESSKVIQFRWAEPPPQKKASARGDGRRQGGNPNSSSRRRP